MTCKILLLFFLTLAPAGQNPAPEDGLTAQERTKVAEQQKIDGRIKVYQSASERYKAALSAAVKKQEYGSVADILNGWSQLLSYSLQDIDKSIVNRKKKSKALIRYEIQLRKAISEAQALKTAAPVEVFDLLNSWSEEANKIRQQMVDIIFPH